MVVDGVSIISPNIYSPPKKKVHYPAPPKKKNDCNSKKSLRDDKRRSVLSVLLLFFFQKKVLHIPTCQKKKYMSIASVVAIINDNKANS